MSRNFTGRIALTKVKNMYISTIDLGVRQIYVPVAGVLNSFLGIEDKYETAVRVDGNWIVVNVYADLEEAKKGHKNIVKQCRKGKTDWEDFRM